MVSDKHANFLILSFGRRATAADIRSLGDEVRRRVHDRFGIVLEWEIRHALECRRPAAHRPGTSRGAA